MTSACIASPWPSGAIVPAAMTIACGFIVCARPMADASDALD